LEEYMKGNFYHKSFALGSVGEFDDSYDDDKCNIDRFVFAFNIMRKIGIEFSIVFSSHAVDYCLTILCFNINGHLFYVKEI